MPAARLADRAEGHRGAVAESREEIDKRREHADRLDPKTRVRDDGVDGAEQGAVRRDGLDHDAAQQHRAEQEAARREADRR